MSPAFRYLGLPTGSDARAIKRAYAARLKTTHPEDDPAGFQQLHAAYQRALMEARWAEEQASQTGEDEYDAESVVEVEARPPTPAALPPEPLAAPDSPPEPVSEATPPPAPVPTPSRVAVPIQLVEPVSTPPATVATPPRAAEAVQLSEWTPLPEIDPEALSAELVQTLDQRGETAALAQLESLLQGTALLGFHAREVFQCRALQALARRPAPPLALLNRLAEAFDWSDHRHPLQRWPEMEVALRAHSAMQARGYLQQLAAGQRTAANSAQRHAARLLLSESSGLWYRFNVANVRGTREFKRLVTALQARYGADWMATLKPEVRKLCLGNQAPPPQAVAPRGTLDTPLNFSMLFALLTGWSVLSVMVWQVLRVQGLTGVALTPDVAGLGIAVVAIGGWLLAKYALFKPYGKLGDRIGEAHQAFVIYLCNEPGIRNWRWGIVLATAATAAMLCDRTAGEVEEGLVLVLFGLLHLGWALRNGGISALLQVGVLASLLTLPLNMLAKHFALTAVLPEGLQYLGALTLGSLGLVEMQKRLQSRRTAFISLAVASFLLVFVVAVMFPIPQV